MQRALSGVVSLGFVLALGGIVSAAEPELTPLWPDGAPGALGSEASDIPGLWISRADPQTANGAAVVVLPGGGYQHLAVGHEGHEIAAWLNARGITAAVVKYRLAPRYRHPAPLQDAARAMRFVRAHASEWNVDPRRVGVMGFSAGGHLAATVSTHFDAGDPDSADPIERQSSRPDFSILCYPVISLKENFTHGGSRRNLLGENPDAELVESLSNETQVSEQTPPTFLFQTNADKPVPAENCIAYFLALRKHNVPVELHVYQEGRHGVGLAADDPVLSTWSERLADWLKANGFLDNR